MPASELWLGERCPEGRVAGFSLLLGVQQRDQTAGPHRCQPFTV